jgi:bifunctional DNA-binding transcriptional regulator/antitoxin component of YhaV-PrlF toxin-antitoxin module
MSKTNWVLTVQEDPETGDQILEFPDDLMQSAGWKEGDVLEWIDNKNGSWLLRKKDGTSTDTTQ